MADLSGYTPIYVRTTGNDTTGSGTSGSPYATAQKAFDIALAAASGNYVIDLGVGSFGGVVLTGNWPSRIAVRGVSAAQSNLGNIFGTGADATGDESCESTTAAVALSVSIVGNKSATLGNITLVGGDDPTTCGIGAANGGSVSLTDCVCGNISLTGGYNESFSGSGGSVSLQGCAAGNITAIAVDSILSYSGFTGGTVALNQSQALNIVVSGSRGMDFGGDGGTVTLIQSQAGSITSNGGYSITASGDGGTVTISDSSTCGNISATGTTSDADGGTGGDVTVTASTSGNIDVSGGYGYNLAGNGGTVTLNQAQAGDIVSNGGQGYENPGDGGPVTVSNKSVCGSIDSNGGYGDYIGSGSGGDVVVNNSTVGNISSVGSSGGNNGGPGGTVAVADGVCGSIICRETYGGVDPDAGAIHTGVVTLSGYTTIPNSIVVGDELITTNLKKGRGINGSSILGVF